MASKSGTGAASSAASGSSSASPAPSSSPPLDAQQRQKIVDGFKIISMCMKNAETGQLVWESSNWDKTFSEDELRIEIPASILQLKAVSREMCFSSVESIRNFHLVQSVSLRGAPLEEWRFNFGFVIPGSTNSWSCTIESAGAEAMIPAEVLSGHVLIETQFFDGDAHVSTTRQRVYYV